MKISNLDGFMKVIADIAKPDMSNDIKKLTIALHRKVTIDLANTIQEYDLVSEFYGLVSESKDGDISAPELYKHYLTYLQQLKIIQHEFFKTLTDFMKNYGITDEYKEAYEAYNDILRKVDENDS